MLLKKYKKLIITFFGVILTATAAVFLVYLFKPQQIQEFRQTVNEVVVDSKNKVLEPDSVTADKVLLSVPFISQAPTANWKDPRQQDGCEEASILMAHLWLTGKTITVSDAEKEIIALSEWQQQKYGEYVDRSISDTAIMMEEYYNHKNLEIKHNITKEDIIYELSKGRLVIVPTSGQILDNPNYSGTGPITHMLPIIGYDKSTNEFITHDPGTRRGSQYRYGFDRVIDAIYDYQTGNHEGYHKTETIMLVVEK